MICVGIDAASDKHDVCIMNNDGQTYKKVFTIHNNASEYKKLLTVIDEARKLWNDSNVSIGIESTGVYSSTLVNYLTKFEDLEIIYINPVLTNMFVRSESIHYAKTDKSDAKSICMFLLDKRKRLYTYTPPSYTILEMKSLGREIRDVSKSITNRTNRLSGIMHVVFPEFFKVFNSIKGTTCLEYLRIYPTPNMIVKKRTLNDIYKNLDKRGNKVNGLDNLIGLAKETIGKYTESDAIVIRCLAEQLQQLNTQKETMLKRMDTLANKHAKALLTIPGIGPHNACVIMGEIGDISNFRGYESLTCYAGINPYVYQSGKYEAKNTRMTKKGSPYLRNALILASRIIVMNDDKFKNYYEKKINEGKHYNTAICHVAKKLTRLIYHILKTGEVYDKSKVVLN